MPNIQEHLHNDTQYDYEYLTINVLLKNSSRKILFFQLNIVLKKELGGTGEVSYTIVQRCSYLGTNPTNYSPVFNLPTQVTVSFNLQPQCALNVGLWVLLFKEVFCVSMSIRTVLHAYIQSYNLMYDFQIPIRLKLLLHDNKWL